MSRLLVVAAAPFGPRFARRRCAPSCLPTLAACCCCCRCRPWLPPPLRLPCLALAFLAHLLRPPPSHLLRPMPLP